MVLDVYVWNLQQNLSGYPTEQVSMGDLQSWIDLY